jgi:hypothetical protein
VRAPPLPASSPLHRTPYIHTRSTAVGHVHQLLLRVGGREGGAAAHPVPHVAPELRVEHVLRSRCVLLAVRDELAHVLPQVIGPLGQ